MRGGAYIRRLWPVAAAALALLAAPAAASASVGPFAMAVQPDGKIVVAGGAGYVGGLNGGREYAAIVRYLPNGKLDRSFGQGDGVLPARKLQPFTAIDLQRDGRIVLTAPVGVVARVLPDGRFDGNFGLRGKTGAGAMAAWYPTSVQVGRSGAIFVGGLTGYLSDPGEAWYGWLYKIARNGLSGERTAGMTSGESDEPKTVINDFVFAPGGAVIAAGTVGERRSDAKLHAALARLVPGTVDPGGGPTGPDPSFGGGRGLVESNLFPASPFSETANAIAWQQGKLLIAGEANTDLMVSRYTADGFLDGGFGHRGFESVGFGRGNMNVANDLAVDARGGIYAAGSSSHGCGDAGCASLLLARFSRSGKIVQKFGRGGLVSPSVNTRLYGRPAKEIAYAVAARPKGKVLVGGLVTGPRSSRFFLRRYLANGKPDRTFGKGGRLTTVSLIAERRR
ncbi:MAG TPA: hypothetical protein VN179_04970 [Solirubrobacterales bacterium]|nr:hypothetical protein [Solirubrobacterales bacterium]